MQQIVKLGLVSIVALMPLTAVADTGAADRLRDEVRRMMQNARDQVFPALVNIEVITVQYWGGQERKGGSNGSGTIMSPEGHVVTNFHVVENGERFMCRISDKREISATLVGEDPLTDLAVLKLNLDELEPGESLPVARWGDSTVLEVGDYVMAMGSPFALSQTVTLGIVSNVERVLGSSDSGPSEAQFASGQRTGLFTNWIQHDALINPGNSGGPLVNLRGEVIGVNTRGGAGQGFATPSSLARRVVDELIEHGEVERSFMGVSLRSIKDTGYDEGVLVNSVIADGPAAKAGLQAGDLIIEFNGEPVTIRFVEQLPGLMKDMADQPVGSQVTVTYLRDGKRESTAITTEKLKRDVGDEELFRGWGLTAMEITERMALEERLESTAGVYVSGVRSGGPAELAEPALEFGDVIQTIDGEPVNSLAELVQRYRTIMDAPEIPDYLLIGFDRGGKRQLTLIKPKPDRDEDPPRELPKAWIGIATQPVVDTLADRLGLGDRTGFRVTRVYPRTKAAETDLQVGDIIIKLNDEDMQPAGIHDAGRLERRVRQLAIGDDATLTVIRDGGEQVVTVPLERTQIEPSEARRDRNRDFELTVREVTFFDRDRRRWDDNIRGVIVQSVEPGGWAAEAGLRGGDLIQEINGIAIRGLPTYRAMMDRIADEKPDRVVFVVLRGPLTSYLFVEPEWAPDLDPEEGSATAAAGV
jgi:serine protease Do